MQDNENELSILETIAKTVQKLGADDCDAICVKSISLSICQRMGSMEKIERSESSDIGVRVFIGSENKLFSLSESSLVLSPYTNSKSKIIGAVGVIGPTRLNYGRIVPIVDYTAQLIGKMISERNA